MLNKIVFMMIQVMKMALQHVVLPLTYDFWRIVFLGKEKQLIVLADSNHDTIPYSMTYLHKTLCKQGHKPVEMFRDVSKGSVIDSFVYALKFMKIYAQAKTVFICDNFLPVISCRKSKKTFVVQLWHACGAFKKFGYEAEDDIPKGYIGHVYRNYNLVTVSSQACVVPFQKSMRQKDGVVQATGISRTDWYTDESWLKDCREEFYQLHPKAQGKKIVLWAPTFRGNAGNPTQTGMDEIQRVERKLGNDYYFIYKVHPHVDSKLHLSNCSMQTERLFCISDVLITDYSSVLFDYMVFNKPFVLFVPDLKEYKQDRGFYLEIESLSPYLAENEEELERTVLQALENKKSEWIQEKREYWLSGCDGQATNRILEKVNH